MGLLLVLSRVIVQCVAWNPGLRRLDGVCLAARRGVCVCVCVCVCVTVCVCVFLIIETVCYQRKSERICTRVGESLFYEFMLEEKEIFAREKMRGWRKREERRGETKEVRGETADDGIKVVEMNVD